MEAEQPVLSILLHIKRPFTYFYAGEGIMETVIAASGAIIFRAAIATNATNLAIAALEVVLQDAQGICALTATSGIIPLNIIATTATLINAWI